MKENEVTILNYSEQNIQLIIGMLNTLMIQGSQAELLANIKNCLQNPILQDKNMATKAK